MTDRPIAMARVVDLVQLGPAASRRGEVRASAAVRRRQAAGVPLIVQALGCQVDAAQPGAGAGVSVHSDLGQACTLYVAEPKLYTLLWVINV